MSELILIATTSKNGLLAINGEIPWDFPVEDIKRFMYATESHPIIMGRKTFEALPKMKPLPGRANIVVSANGFAAPEGVIRCPTLEEALHMAREKDETSFVIGGQTLYDATIDKATKLMLTRVHVSYSYDQEKCRRFPYIDTSVWRRSSEKNCGSFSFLDYERIQPSG